MSGQEEQSPQDINNVDHQVDNDSYDSYDSYERFANLLMLASAPASNSRSRTVLDYMYGNGISLVPIPIPIPMNGAVAGGGALDGLYDFESAAASILGRSLYDRCPVKNVITDEACDEIVDRKFTSAMVEELKINGTCGIWQEDFKEGEDIKILPCNHAFNAGAILKWLREEKAECPMCRLSLRSKEVIPPQLQNLENSGHEQAHQDPDEAHAEAPQQDNPVVRVNNIAYRLAESVAGRVNHHHHHHHHHDHDHHSISVPMNRLLQNIRMSSSSLRLREPVRAAAPSSGGAAAAPAPAPVSAADIGREVHAEAIHHNIEPANHHIINNYYLNNINNIIRYNRNDDNNRNNYDNRNNNNYDNDDERNAADREQADIEEAIRRSLQQY